MTDGEFYKIIVNLSGYGSDWLDKAIGVEEVMEVIKQAKQEFPAFSSKGNTKESAIISCYRQWLRKWFGEEC